MVIKELFNKKNFDKQQRREKVLTYFRRQANNYLELHSERYLKCIAMITNSKL